MNVEVSLNLHFALTGVLIMKDEIILKIMELEEQVEKITKDAIERQKNLPKETHEKYNKIENRLQLEYDININKSLDAIKKEASDKIEALKKEKISRFEAMEKNFNENHAKWENEIYSNVIRW